MHGNEWKWKHNNPKPVGHCKSSAKGKVNSNICIPQFSSVQLSSVQSLSRVRLFATPWIAARQAYLSITNCWTLPKPMSIELVMPSNHLILCLLQSSSVQSLSCVRLFATPWIEHPGLPVHHHLLEFTQTHIHRVCDAIQPSHPQSSPSPSAPNPCQHQSLFQWVNTSHEEAKVLELQL